MTPSFLVRAASRPGDGAGHVSRCRILARALARHAPTTMVIDRPDAGWRARLQGESFAVAEAGAEPDGRLDGAVVDAYELAEAEWQMLRRRASLLAQLDDFLQPHADVDLVINAAPHLDGDRVDGRAALLGPSYALVDPKFAAIRRPVAAVAAAIFVGFGMVDSGNATGLCLDALRQIDRSFAVTVVVGSTAPHLRAVQAAADAMGAECLVDEADVAACLARADIAIGAGGVSLLERMAAGIPTLSLAIAPNQMMFLAGAAERGATRFMGLQEQITVSGFADAIVALADDVAARTAMGAAARALVDGRGGDRLAAALIAKARALQ